MKVEFLKTRYYKNVKYNKGDITEMSELDTPIYLQCKIVKIATQKKSKNKKHDYSKLGYKELRKLCKLRGVRAVGKKDELIALLTGSD